TTTLPSTVGADLLVGAETAAAAVATNVAVTTSSMPTHLVIVLMRSLLVCLLRPALEWASLTVCTKRVISRLGGPKRRNLENSVRVPAAIPRSGDDQRGSHARSSECDGSNERCPDGRAEMVGVRSRRRDRPAQRHGAARRAAAVRARRVLRAGLRRPRVARGPRDADARQRPDHLSRAPRRRAPLPRGASLPARRSEPAVRARGHSRPPRGPRRPRGRPG